MFDCFGRPTSIAGGNQNNINNNLTTTSNHSGNSSLSKHQLKKQKKAEKKQRRGHKGRGKGKGGSLAPSCIRPNNEDEENAKSEKMKRRTTEKSQVGDQEDLARSQRTAEGDSANQGAKRGESSRFKKLMAARRVERLKESGDEGGSDEDSEYDVDEDEEDDSLGGQDKDGPLHSNGQEKKDVGKDEKEARKEETTEEESEEEDSEETESESKNNESDAGSSKKKGSSTGERESVELEVIRL